MYGDPKPEVGLGLQNSYQPNSSPGPLNQNQNYQRRTTEGNGDFRMGENENAMRCEKIENSKEANSGRPDSGIDIN